MKPIKVLIADDQRLFAESLRTLLQRYSEDVSVVGIAANGREAVRRTEVEKPDVVLMDVRMPLLDGVDATREIMERSSDVKVLVLSTFDEDEYVQNALRVGASGYLLKDISPTELIASIRAIKEGTVQISPSVAAKLVEQIHGERNEYTRRIGGYESLSKRERDILRLIIMGYGNAQIAEKLYLAEQTVRNYVSSIYAKLGVHDRFEIIRLGNELTARDSSGE